MHITLSFKEIIKPSFYFLRIITFDLKVLRSSTLDAIPLKKKLDANMIHINRKYLFF